MQMKQLKHQTIDPLLSCVQCIFAPSIRNNYAHVFIVRINMIAQRLFSRCKYRLSESKSVVDLVVKYVML